ncbi:MAG TPA: hypothetical protein V6D46_08360 [Coleofasciculaceae cyanobacterium]
MQALPPATIERLRQLPILRTTWQGDVRSIHSRAIDPRARPEAMQACVVWMDTTQPALRALEPVFEEAGYGAIVRVLIQAIEQPHGQLPPGRPQKIVVCDRELQFFLRGALQGLDIKIEYTAQLPLIDSVVATLEHHQPDPQPVPDAYFEPLMAAVATVWDDAVWEILAEHEILAIHLNQWDIDTLYLSALGMGGMEMGLLLYRSLDSLERFRNLAIDINTKLEFQKMQEAFLNQDCLFITFDDETDDDPPPFGIPPEDDEDTVVPELGSIHPLEGLRNHLSDTESLALIVVLEALHRFVKKHRRALTNADSLPSLSNKFRIPSPIAPTDKPITVQIETLPDVTDRLWQLIEQGSTAHDSPHPTPIANPHDQRPGLPTHGHEDYPELIATLLAAAEASGDRSPRLLAPPVPIGSPQLPSGLDDTQPVFRVRNLNAAPRTDWIPEGSLLSINNNITWDVYDMLPPFLLIRREDADPANDPVVELASASPKAKAKTKGRKAASGEPKVIRSRGLPLILLQTSQPKAKALLRQFDEWGNPVSAGFFSTYDSVSGDPFDVLLICTDRRQMLVFDLFWHDHPIERRTKDRWYDRTNAAGKRCALVIAKGVTGQQRGAPGLEEMMRIYDLQALSQEDIKQVLMSGFQVSEIKLP